jgi:hypothetical protein
MAPRQTNQEQSAEKRIRDGWWAAMLHEQQRGGFPGLAGAQLSATIPISDELISRVIAEHLPSRAPVREVSLVAHAGNEFTVRVRLTRPAMLPPIQVRLAIEQQPALPMSPVLVLALVSRGIASIALNALNVVEWLPPGVRFEGSRFFIDLRVLLERRAAAEAFAYLTDLAVTTADRRVIVQARAALPAQQ